MKQNTYKLDQVDKINAEDWYASCTLDELANIQMRVNYVIEQRLLFLEESEYFE